MNVLNVTTDESDTKLLKVDVLDYSYVDGDEPLSKRRMTKLMFTLWED